MLSELLLQSHISDKLMLLQQLLERMISTPWLYELLNVQVIQRRVRQSPEGLAEQLSEH